MLTISFMTTLGVNVGDEFIREGIRAILERAGIPYSPLYVNKHDPASLHEPREDETRIVADKFWDSDVFIQSGAPVYWNFGEHSSLTSEWAVWLWKDRILNRSKTGPLFLNLGAGSCQPWNDEGAAFLNDPGCRGHAQDAGERAVVTVVRDRVASKILSTLNVTHQALPCPAFLAAARHRFPAASRDVIGINLMPKGAHYDISGTFDHDRWNRACDTLCASLRASGRLFFIAHDKPELEFMQRFARPTERVVLANGWRDYLDIYAACAVVVANRVHGAVCAAGFGIPGIIMGNDTRALIGEYIGLSVVGSNSLLPEAVAAEAAAMLRQRDQHRDTLLALRESALSTYAQLITPALAPLLCPA
jgi:hypothetical protein